MKNIQYLVMVWMLIALALLATACSTEPMAQENQLSLIQTKQPPMKQVMVIRNTGGRRASPVTFDFVDWYGNTQSVWLHNRDAGIQIAVKDSLIINLNLQQQGFSEPTTIESEIIFESPARPQAQRVYDSYLWGIGGYNSNVVGYTLYFQ